MLHSLYRTVFDGTVLYDGRQGEAAEPSRFGELTSA